MNAVHLLLSSRYDLSTDYISAELEDRGLPYIRINSEDLTDLEVSWVPVPPGIRVRAHGVGEIMVGMELRSVLARRPTFLRSPELNPMASLQAHHWLTFFRGLQSFENVRWMNRPGYDFTAENKMVQLAAASRVGFSIPQTVVTNSSHLAADAMGTEGNLIIKGLDTVLWREEYTQFFTYTEPLNYTALIGADLSALPAIIQEALEPKLDLRVTIVGKRAWAVKISADGDPIEGDWRLHKDSVSYELHTLPQSVMKSCLALMSELGLAFGAIDLVIQNGRHIFLEINPLGEWAWLDERLDLGIAKAIVDWLTQP